jgi:hypothetical protein
MESVHEYLKKSFHFLCFTSFRLDEVRKDSSHSEKRRMPKVNTSWVLFLTRFEKGVTRELKASA